MKIPFKTALLIGLCVMFTWLANPAFAEDDPALSPPEVTDVYQNEDGNAESFAEADGVSAFGLGTQDYWIAAMEFAPQNGTDIWAYDIFTFYSAPNGGVFNKQVELPWGARMTILECFFNDTSGSNGTVRLWKNTQTIGGSRNNLLKATASSSGSGGFQFPFQSMNELTKFREGSERNFYWLQASMPATTAVSLRGCRIFWNKVIRTGLSHPFNDIGGLSQNFQDSIAALYQSGITTGTSPTTYSPFNPVTRGQMAAFLARALGLHYPN
jgi:S-layer homology domain